MNDQTRTTSGRGLGLVLVIGFGALLIFALVTPTLPTTVPILASAGILSGLAICIRSRWTHLIEACAAGLVGVVFLGAGVVALVTADGSVVSSLLLAALGLACGAAAVLRVRAHRRNARAARTPEDG